MIQILAYSFYFRLNKLVILIFPILVIFFSGYYFNLKIGGYGSDLLNSLYFSGYVFTISPMIDMSELYDLNFFVLSDEQSSTKITIIFFTIIKLLIFLNNLTKFLSSLYAGKIK